MVTRGRVKTLGSSIIQMAWRSCLPVDWGAHSDTSSLSLYVALPETTKPHRYDFKTPDPIQFTSHAPINPHQSQVYPVQYTRYIYWHADRWEHYDEYWAPYICQPNLHAEFPKPLQLPHHHPLEIQFYDQHNMSQSRLPRPLTCSYIQVQEHEP